MIEIDFFVEADPDGGLVARASGHSLVTQAANEAELRVSVRDAVACHFGRGSVPEVIHLHFIQPGIKPMDA